MAEKNVVLRGLINDTSYDFMPKTNVYNVQLDSTVTLADKLSEIITALNGKVTSAQMTAAIKTAIDEATSQGQISGVGIESIEIEEVVANG